MTPGIEKRPSAPVSAVLSPMATVSPWSPLPAVPTTRPVTSIAEAGTMVTVTEAVSPGPALAVTVAVVSAWTVAGGA